jgi:hypothetical protein
MIDSSFKNFVYDLNLKSIHIKNNNDFFDIDLTKDAGNLDQFLKL